MSSDEYLFPQEYHPVSSLKWISRQWDLLLVENMRDRIQFLTREFKFLDIFLSFASECTMADVTEKVRAQFQEDAVNIEKICMIENLDPVTSRVLNNIWLSKLEIRAN